MEARARQAKVDAEAGQEERKVAKPRDGGDELRRRRRRVRYDERYALRPEGLWDRGCGAHLMEGCCGMSSRFGTELRSMAEARGGGNRRVKD